MNRLEKLVSCGLGLFAAAACSSSMGSGSTSSTGGGSSTGTGHTTGTGGSTGTGQLKAACATPAMMPGGDFKAATGQHFWGLQLVWGGAEAAIAYAESTAQGGWSIKLQPLTPAGATKGAAIELGTSSAPQGPVVTVATDGSRYVVCWDQAGSGGDQTMCSAVAAGAATPGVSVAGYAPSVAFGAGGWALAYVDSNIHLSLQELDDDAKVKGSLVQLGQTSADALSLLATPSGYALLVGSGRVYRLDAALKDTLMGPVVISFLDSSHLSAAAASGDAVGVGLVLPTENDFVVVDPANNLSNKLAADDGKAMTYSHMAAAGGKSSFAVVWSDFGGFIGYRAIDATDQPIGAVQQLAMTMWDDNPVTIAAVDDGFLVATAAGLGLDDLTIVHLGCP